MSHTSRYISPQPREVALPQRVPLSVHFSPLVVRDNQGFHKWQIWARQGDDIFRGTVDSIAAMSVGYPFFEAVLLSGAKWDAKSKAWVKMEFPRINLTDEADTIRAADYRPLSEERALVQTEGNPFSIRLYPPGTAAHWS